MNQLKLAENRLIGNGKFSSELANQSGTSPQSVSEASSFLRPARPNS